LVLADTLAEARRLELPPSGSDGDDLHAVPEKDGGAADVDVAAAIEDLMTTLGSVPAAGAPDEGEALDADELYGRAADYVRAGQPAAALAALLALKATPNAGARAARGLATLALRHARDDAALLLAEKGLSLAPGHPRDSLVAGLVELQRNHRRSAQVHLAAAARNARHRPEFREDLRLAQRALLLLHLS
jgi:predicted Zn-dependent protease